MGIAFGCDACGKHYTAKDEFAGKSIKCKECGKVLRVPGTGAAARPASKPQAKAPADPPPNLDIFGFDEEPAKGSPSAAQTATAESDAPELPRVGAPPRPKTKEEKKAFEKRVKEHNRQRSSFAQPFFGASAGVLVVIALFGFKFYRRVIRPIQRMQARAAAREHPGGTPRAPRKIGPITTPAFPDLGPGVALAPGVRFHEVKLGPTTPVPESPGHRGKLWLYLPEGQHAEQSLPCILIAGAGSNLITGMNLSDGDRTEHVPYVKEGFAVLAYELDGAMPDDDDDSDEEFADLSGAFLAAQAGLVNARNALDFLAKKVPAVDPARTYTVGHSSAGTMALLLAENEPRIKACVAFAPAVDTASRIPAVLQTGLAQEVPGAGDFFTRYNPKLHEEDIQCPVFLFHAQDDSNVPVTESVQCKERLQQLGKSVTLETVPTGDHYDGMVSQGIPRAIAWLKSLPAAQ